MYPHCPYLINLTQHDGIMYLTHLIYQELLLECVSHSAIRELSSKALHNLTPQAPDYMSSTGKQCNLTCYSGSGESRRLMRDV